MHEDGDFIREYEGINAGVRGDEGPGYEGINAGVRGY